jgi:hypothetical protein
VTERDDLVPAQPEAASMNGFMPLSGDPSLELFGQGWSPDHASAGDDGPYRGRHRAEDA